VAWPRVTITLLNGDSPTCHHLVGGYVSLQACGGLEIPQYENSAPGARRRDSALSPTRKLRIVTVA
jgi:hypothetical protein